MLTYCLFCIKVGTVDIGFVSMKYRNIDTDTQFCFFTKIKKVDTDLGIKNRQFCWAQESKRQTQIWFSREPKRQTFVWFVLELKKTALFVFMKTKKVYTRIQISCPFLLGFTSMYGDLNGVVLIPGINGRTKSMMKLFFPQVSMRFATDD